MKNNKSRDCSRLLCWVIYYRHFVPIFSAAIFSVTIYRAMPDLMACLLHATTLCIVEHAVFLHVENAIDDELTNAIAVGVDVSNASGNLAWLHVESEASFEGTLSEVNGVII
jgi:hypothetical protein